MIPVRTELHLRPSDWQITHRNRLITAGSCFADLLGAELQQHKFVCHSNAFGTTYSPVALNQLFGYSLSGTLPPADSNLERESLHLNYNFHSSVAGYSAGELQLRIRAMLDGARQSLQNAQYVVITWGTAWAWERLDNQALVSNCHRMPAKFFRKRLLTVNEIVSSSALFLDQLMRINAGARVLLSVSPVRHTRDSLEGNSVSKSTLRLAAHQVCEQFQQVQYFPAYEIMVDDLRDYRYYGDDLIHPSALAGQYIWEKFQDRYFSTETRQVLADWALVQRALHHRPVLPHRAEHHAFLERTREALLPFANYFDITDELRDADRQLREFQQP